MTPTRTVALLFLFLVACGSPLELSDEYGPEMSLTNLTPAGLYTSPSALSSVPPGAMLRADNVVLGRPGLVETRRGFERLAGAFPQAGGVKSWVAFKGAIIGWGGGVLARLNTTTGVWTAYSGTYLAPPGVVKVSFAESVSCLFFTTSKGLYRLDTPTSTPVPAGVSQALDGTAAVVGNGAAATGTVTLGGSAGNVTVVIGGTSVGPIAYAGSDTATATAVASAINANATTAALVTATSAGAVITIKADTWGTAGNTITLTASRTAGTITTSGGNLAGGVNGSGFLTPGTTVAYRYLWGTRDANDRLILGAPSGRVLVSNASGGSGNVTLTVTIPDGITTAHFLQVYRSASAVIGDSPSDEMRQVQEVFPTATALASRTITVTDVDPIRGGPTLYTSPNLGDGILASRYQPPLCTSLAEWDGRLWCGATVQRQSIMLTLLSTSITTNGMDVGDGITISDGVSTEFYVASTSEVTNTPPNSEFIVTLPSASVSPSQAVAATAQSIVHVINLASTMARAQYVSGDGDVPGNILIEARALDSPELTIRALYGSNNGTCWVPRLGYSVTGAVMRRDAFGTVTVGSVGLHGFSPGQVVNLESSPDPLAFPTGLKTIVIADPFGGFTYTEAGPVVFPPIVGGVFTTTYDDATTSATDDPNSIAYSNDLNPDAVTLTAYDVVGNATKRVLALIPLSESLFVVKEDGLFRVTGNSPESFSIEPWDSTVQFTSPDAVTVLDGQAFALATEGVVTWGENSRPRPTSVPIESTLRSLAEVAPTAVRNTAFMTPYDSDRRLVLWVPSSASSTTAEQAFVFNTLTGAWTRWTVPATTALVNPADNRLYLVPPTGNVQRERKTGTAADYQGPDGEAVPVDVQWVAETAGAPHMGKLWGIVEFFLAGQVPTVATAYFQTEVTPTPASTPTFANNGSRPGVVETVVTPDHARSAGLAIGFQHSVPQEKVELQGYGVRFRAYQGRR